MTDIPVPIMHLSLNEEMHKNRRKVYWTTWPGAGLAGSTLGASVALGLMDFSGIGWLGALTGGGFGLALRVLAEPRFWINNSTTNVFMTFDPLKRLFGRADILTLYPPGPSVCYPQEQRFVENTVSLKEATVVFEFAVVCTNGIITGAGSFRLRVNQDQPVVFQVGVAAVAEDLRDLIIAEAVRTLATKQVSAALKALPSLNDALQTEFVKGETDFENRFGVHVGDVTIGQLKPSSEVQKTLSSITEAAAVSKGAAILLGYTSMNKVNEALAAGKLTNAEVKDARDRFLSVSGNLEGMDIKRNEYVLSAQGVDPKLAEAITALATNAPELIQAWRQSKRKR